MRRLLLGLLLGGIAVALVATGVALWMVPNGNGKLAVAVHDAPCAACSHVWVTFTAVSVHEANATANATGNSTGNDTGGWTTLTVTGETVDLESLNGSAFARTVGILSLPAGHYEQIRLGISQVVVQFGNSTNATAQLAGNGFALVHGEFTVTGGATTTVSIDIDLASSVHVEATGAVMFTPNIGTVTVS